MELVYHDPDRWQTNAMTFLTVYTRPVNIYIRFANTVVANLIEHLRVAQPLPFSQMWYQPIRPTFPDNMWDAPETSHETSHRVFVYREARHRSE